MGRSILPILFILFSSLTAHAEPPNPLLPEGAAADLYRTQKGAAPQTPTVQTVQVTASPRSRFSTYFVNPFLAYDIGLSTNAHQVPEEAYGTVLSWLVHRSQGDEPATPTQRLKRDGRVVYTGYVPLTSYHTGAANPTLARVEQKGDLPIPQLEKDKDGHVSASQTLTAMVVGEILHRQGVYTTRGLLGAELKDVKRNLSSGNPPAGVELRVGGRTRFDDKKEDPYFQVLDQTVPEWSHPLLGPGLQHLPPERRRALIAQINEGILKDLWALHGSLIDNNRAEAMTDLTSFAFLSEPNLGARIQGASTTYYAEVRNAEAVAESLFLDSFAFHQLRRLGLPDDVILEQCFEKVVEKLPNGETFTHYRAKDATREFARTILALDLQTAQSPHPFYAGEEKEGSASARCLFNTRRLLRSLIADPAGPWSKESIDDGTVDGLLKGSYFDSFDGKDPMVTGELRHLRDGKRIQLRKLHGFVHRLAPYLAQNHAAVVARADAFSLEQNLPSRTEINRQTAHWLTNPLAFQPQFVALVEKTDPPHGHTERASYYAGRTLIPDGTTIGLFFKLMRTNGCVVLWGKNRGPTTVGPQ